MYGFSTEPQPYESDDDVEQDRPGPADRDLTPSHRDVVRPQERARDAPAPGQANSARHRPWLSKRSALDGPPHVLNILRRRYWCLSASPPARTFVYSNL